MSGLVALHGGGEYVPGDEPAMDALLSAALTGMGTASGSPEPSIVLLPTAAARQHPALAAAEGARAFHAAAARAGLQARVDVAEVLTRDDAGSPEVCALLEAADLVHLPGGDPDVIPTVLRDTPAWAAVLSAYARGACLAGASAGAMALAARTWTPDGAIDGLGLVPGVAVLPHYAPARLASWRATVERDGPRVSWLGLDERTLVLGRPGEGAWRVAGTGRAHLIPPEASVPIASAGHGMTIPIG